jgi:hypothetical protein
MAKETIFDPKNLEITVPSLDGRPAWKVKPIPFVETDIVNINEDMSQHAAKVAWIGALYADAKYERERLKGVRDQVEGGIILEYLSSLSPDGKRPTGQAAEAYVPQQQAYIGADLAYLDMARTVDRLDGMRTALEHRMQLMVSIASNKRREMDGGDPGRLTERIHEKEGREAKYREQLRSERGTKLEGRR